MKDENDFTNAKQSAFRFCRTHVRSLLLDVSRRIFKMTRDPSGSSFNYAENFGNIEVDVRHHTYLLPAVPSAIKWTRAAVCGYFQRAVPKAKGEGSLAEIIQRLLLVYRNTPNNSAPKTEITGRSTYGPETKNDK
uniref:Hypotheticial protein n=1 Tax=Schistosoma japonicum TaxID=6182 RepID=C7TXZ4_SCHJA|nr:hypotheticial protein [Schistosoma japonicum]